MTTPKTEANKLQEIHSNLLGQTSTGNWVTVQHLYDLTDHRVVKSKVELIKFLLMLQQQAMVERHPDEGDKWRAISLLEGMAVASLDPPSFLPLSPDQAECAVAHFEWLLDRGALTSEDAVHVQTLRQLVESYRSVLTKKEESPNDGSLPQV